MERHPLQASAHGLKVQGQEKDSVLPMLGFKTVRQVQVHGHKAEPETASQ